MNANQGNVTDAAMAGQWLPYLEEDMSESGSDSYRPVVRKKYNAGGQAASESGSEASTVQSSVRSRRNVPPRKSSYDTAAEKSELLYKIDRLKKRGFASHRTVTFDDDLDSIRLVRTYEQEHECRKSIKFQRSLLISFASGAEFLNSTFDPIRTADGWSDSVNENR
jgi:hypothetical protein